MQPLRGRLLGCATLLALKEVSLELPFRSNRGDDARDSYVCDIANPSFRLIRYPLCSIQRDDYSLSGRYHVCLGDAVQRRTRQSRFGR